MCLLSPRLICYVTLCPIKSWVWRRRPQVITEDFKPKIPIASGYKLLSGIFSYFIFVDVEWGLAVLSAWMWESPALPQGKTQPPEVSPACQNKNPGHYEEIRQVFVFLFGTTWLYMPCRGRAERVSLSRHNKIQGMMRKLDKKPNHKATSDPDEQPKKKFWESHREENTRREIAQQALRMNYTVFAQSDSIRWHRAGLPPQQIGLKVIFWDQKVKRFKWITRMGHCG